jgi:methylated-DNA-[protein]-cysteine S-methyltransferase
MHDKKIHTEYFNAPFGLLKITASASTISGIKKVAEASDVPNPDTITRTACAQLEAYFRGELKQFDLPVDLSGISAFQQKILNLLMQIPYGSTLSYTDLSLQYGDLKSIRAVASANARNPIPIIIPCHRVIGRDGSLRGFALGLEVKQYLLEIENPGRRLRQSKLEL